MKTFYDLTDEEKVALTEEQVTYYAKVECANRGIIIPQKPINNLKEVEKPSSKYYQVGYESFVFESEQEAQEYLNSKSKALTVKTIGSGYSNPQYVSKREVSTTEIKTTVLYSAEQVSELKSILEYNIETQKEWNTYNESLKEYNEIVSNIWEEVGEIAYKNSRVDYFNKIYTDYLTLADNNKDIAYNFFSKAYKNANLSDVDREVVDNILSTPREFCVTQD